MMEAKVLESYGDLFLVHPIRVEGPSGTSNEYDAIIDTGFTGEIALPPSQCAQLGLAKVRVSYTMFGNSSIEGIGVYRANLFWCGSWRNVSVLATGNEALIGMDLLRGSSVCFDAVNRGEISIESYTPDVR